MMHTHPQPTIRSSRTTNPSAIHAPSLPASCLLGPPPRVYSQPHSHPLRAPLYFWPRILVCVITPPTIALRPAIIFLILLSPMYTYVSRSLSILLYSIIYSVFILSIPGVRPIYHYL
ncbi:hypothetical protein DFH07DRAFT_854527 [Mycena maculata]|uniref:Uncharacterized protein n=1 Tax=Mycena maculata TaxID=230809 RepID=A0AAD7HNY2_9AGAR|nr:hypothetical protein DFH07DRAFT_854527 [Mycena maculata]